MGAAIQKLTAQRQMPRHARPSSSAKAATMKWSARWPRASGPSIESTARPSRSCRTTSTRACSRAT
eukprot:1479025-Prymnesium_polylepis.1